MAASDPAARDRLAVEDPTGRYTHADLAAATGRVAAALAQQELGREKAGGPARVAFLVPPGFAFAAVLAGTWRAGAVAVPLGLGYPRGELEHVIDDSGAALLVAAAATAAGPLAEIAAERGVPLRLADDLLAGPPRTAPAPAAPPAAPCALPSLFPSPAATVPQPDLAALLLYTSGTTGRPKGVVHTFATLAAQVAALTEAWAIGPADRLLHLLPLHHTHGLVNALLCPLAAGGAVEFPGAKFEPEAVWERFSRGGTTLFMAVPTIYARLVAAWEAAEPARRERWTRGARALRLMVSGSAPLPVPLFERAREATGHALLERYGMTEIGMALSNPLAGERVPGAVGRPLPGVEVRIVDDAGGAVAAGASGELLVRGPAVFAGYWRRPQETRAAFRPAAADDPDRRPWFATGDEAVCDAGVYRLLGRRSADILKVGGFKISALEIETVLAGHPDLAEVAVLGLADPDWGQRVAAAVAAAPGRPAPTLDALRAWAADRLAPAKLPTRLLVLPALPRNALGKVVKGELGRRFQAAAPQGDATLSE